MADLFDSTETSRLFGLPLGVDFSTAFLDGLMARLGAVAPEDLARVELFTNTRRAARRWEELLSASGARLLPKIRVITDLAEDDMGGGTSALSQQLLLMQAVRRLLESGVSLAPVSASFDLAGTLSSLMDELDGEGVPRDGLSKLDVSEYSQHWQTALRFLQLIQDAELAGDAAPASDARLRLAVTALAATWEIAPPQHPVIIAGSTGSRGTTALFMQAVAKLPQGAVVLPGVDFDLNARSWKVLEEQATAADHPQFGFAQLCRKIGCAPQDIMRWSDVKPASGARNQLVSLAMRPAPVTDEWITEGPDHLDALDAATGEMSLMTPPTERIEASAIALALRDALERGETAALITPDATISRRVTAELDRWDVTPDDSAGVPLRVTPPAILADLVMRAAGRQTETSAFLALVMHPLSAAGWDRSKHLLLARALDVKLLRNIGPYIIWSDLLTWAEQHEGAVPWVSWLQDVCQSISAEQASLGTWVEAHRKVLGLIAAGPEAGSDGAVWDKAQGAALVKVFDTLETASDAAGLLSQFDYATILKSLIGAETVREPGFAPDKRVAIWGQLEARVQNADLIILAGLNEGVWPDLPSPDPWLSRPLRQQLGLQLPERRVGLSAHDFQQAIANKRVILSRSEKQDNTPTVPSRWLTRLENLMQGMGHDGETAFASMTARGATYVGLARALERPLADVPRAPRPAPAPPQIERPVTVSVTQVETLVRDPFQIYAYKVLGLRPLPMIGRAPDARDRGTALHRALEAFVERIHDAIPDAAIDVFRDVVFEALQAHVPWPSVRRIWHARLMRIADDFIVREGARRTIAMPHLREARGRVALKGFERDISLVGTADRIDVSGDGGVAIYDYKSSVPSDKQAKVFSKQLPLEARMAMLGGFDNLSPARAIHLELIGLSKAGDSLELSAEPEEIETIWGEFRKIIAHFEDPMNGYASRLRPMKNVDWGDYDHLARRGEWDDGADAVVEFLK